jgi:hypothetical protein
MGHGAARSLGVFLLSCAAAGASAQEYECRTKEGNTVLQYGVPCAPGMDARDPKREAAKRRQLEREMKKEQENRERDFASMRGEVRVGMSAEQVLRAWGNPSRRSMAESAQGPADYWYWKCARQTGGSNFVMLRNGKVTYVRVSC